LSKALGGYARLPDKRPFSSANDFIVGITDTLISFSGIVRAGQFMATFRKRNSPEG
jgi:hypothetical protein